MSRADEAIKLHDKGYNCAQATACVFADKKIGRASCRERV